MRTESEIRALVAAFENHTLRYEEWTHAAHLTVAAVYANDYDDCIDRIRQGIPSLNAHFGVPQTPEGGYHDTLTIAWMHLIRHHVRSMPDASFAERIDSAVEKFLDKKAILDHYSRERIMSIEARYGWVEPDLSPLPE